MTSNSEEQQDEFVSIFDLLKFVNSQNIINATYQIISILEETGKNVCVYERHNGIKPRLTIQKESLRDYLFSINKNQGYKIDEEIPF
ncbi:hypothetical protein [Rodentibacter sp. Ppn85]|uniref:hypothetical protein n=1 Tax=Rodentibacter sp. Ppn85 TaxID=1908525 RepID=UPI00098687FC|nr:hypothetical protein [Rodentibacter sp. Ppn85]OOF64706.1 hypothetical protein BKL51_06875 [Rodentibacter sp. Ppn85]